MSDALPLVESHLAAGEGWVLSRGRDRTSGDERLVVTLAAVELAEIRRTLAVVGSVGGPHVAQVVDTVSLADGSTAVLFAVPGGPSLAEVVHRRGTLSAAEAVTIVAPLAGLLCGLEARGLCLRGLAAETVWFARDGRPVLVPVAIGADADATPHLAAAVARHLDPSSPGAAQVRSALDAAAAGQLSATALRDALLRAVPAAPVAIVPPRVPPSRSPRRQRVRPQRVRRERVRRLPALRLGRARPVVAIAVVVLLAIGLGGLWGRGDGDAAVLSTPPAAVVAMPALTAPSWTTVMTALERERAAAYATGDVTRLDAVYANGSAEGAADRRMLEKLVARQQRAAGLRAFVEDVSVVATIGERATLRVTDALTSYDVIGPTGHVVRHGSGRPARQWRVVLVKTVEGWRIWSVTPAT